MLLMRKQAENRLASQGLGARNNTTYAGITIFDREGKIAFLERGTHRIVFRRWHTVVENQ